MSTQIYLFLSRETDPEFGGISLQSLKDIILGDSTDLPFLKWIRVQNVSHSIEFEGGSTETKIVQTEGVQAKDDQNILQVDNEGNPVWDEEPQEKTTTTEKLGSKPVDYSQARPTTTTKKLKIRFAEIGEERTNSLPEHGDFTFTKFTDNATPQLAYACSAQEPLTNAFFAFRRKIGTGVRGIRVPFMVIWLKKCLITEWSFDGVKETVALNYQKVTWATYDQVTDWNVPTGMSNRYFQTSNVAGGEDAAMYVKMGVLAGVAVAAAAVDEIASSAAGSSGIQRGSGSSHTDFIE